MIIDRSQRTAYEREKALNLRAYDTMRDELLEKYEGQYVAIVQGRLVAVTEVFEEALAAVEDAVPEALHSLVFQAGDEPIRTMLNVGASEVA